MFYWRERDGETQVGVPGTPSVVIGGPHQERVVPVDRAFTRVGPGAGDGPYGGLNLGGHVGDDPEVVERNRGALADQVGVPRRNLLFMEQVHGVDVAVIEDGPLPSAPPRADAIVTARADVALAVLVADCVPVLLADEGGAVVGAVHAGRPGMVGGIVGAAVERMRALGASGTIHAAVGPSVCGRCYEVPAQMRDDAARTSPVSATVSWTGTPAVDVAAGVVDQLHGLGAVVTWIPGCTREDPDLYSYRRSGTTGRFAGVVRRTRGA